MKKTTCIILIVTLCPILLFGQEKLNKLRAPTSPASSILGIQPSVVLSPKTYQALETSLYSNFMNSNTGTVVIPNDFALEFTPYWTMDHGLSLTDYLYPSGILDQVARNSSFSIASTQKYYLGDSTPTNALAYGYRTTFYFSNEKDRKEVNDYRNNLGKSDDIIITIHSRVVALFLPGRAPITSRTAFADSIKKTVTISVTENYNASEAQEIIREILDTNNMPNPPSTLSLDFNNQIDELVNKVTKGSKTFEAFRDYIKERQGLMLDVAYSGVINFPTNNFEYSFVPKQALWLTPTYRFKDEWSFLSVMVVYRYEWYDRNYFKKYFPATKVYTNNNDLGVAVSGKFKKFAIQVEAVKRYSSSEIPAGTDSQGNQLFRKDNSSDFQYVGSFSYNLTDQIVLTYSLGNRFAPIQNPGNTLVSLLSLNFGFGAPTISDVNLRK